MSSIKIADWSLIGFGIGNKNTLKVFIVCMKDTFFADWISLLRLLIKNESKSMLGPQMEIKPITINNTTLNAFYYPLYQNVVQ